MVVCCMYFFETIPEARVEKGGYKLAHIHVQIRHLFKSKSTLEWNVDSDEVIGREREKKKKIPLLRSTIHRKVENTTIQKVGTIV